MSRFNKVMLFVVAGYLAVVGWAIASAYPNHGEKLAWFLPFIITWPSSLFASLGIDLLVSDAAARSGSAAAYASLFTLSGLLNATAFYTFCVGVRWLVASQNDRVPSKSNLLSAVVESNFCSFSGGSQRREGR